VSQTAIISLTAPVAISFVQVAAATPSSATSVAVAYPSAQLAGNLNIVVVGWSDSTATIKSVKDSAGNKYILAIGPTTLYSETQAIYYASKVLGGKNTVTVTFNQAATYPDIRVLEYRGVSTVDVAIAATGTSQAMSTGAMTTRTANELIFSANTVSNWVQAPGTGFFTRIITSDGDLAEDQFVSSAGSYSGTATLADSGPWVMQVVGFK
jgi:hypothetical protein